jgi:hypothetical protein
MHNLRCLLGCRLLGLQSTGNVPVLELNFLDIDPSL